MHAVEITRIDSKVYVDINDTTLAEVLGKELNVYPRLEAFKIHLGKLTLSYQDEGVLRERFITGFKFRGEFTEVSVDVEIRGKQYTLTLSETEASVNGKVVWSLQ